MRRQRDVMTPIISPSARELSTLIIRCTPASRNWPVGLYAYAL